MTWFFSPDQVGGWKTDKKNQSDNMLELLDRINASPPDVQDFSPIDFSSIDFETTKPPSPGEQIYFFVNPSMYQVNDQNSEYYPLGITPIGLDTTKRALIGVKPYG